MADELEFALSLDEGQPHHDEGAITDTVAQQTDNELSSHETEHDGGNDTMANGDMKVTVAGESTTLVTWLEAQVDHINAFHEIEPVSDCIGLKIIPSHYQKLAVACIERNCQSPFKGVLIADPPGLGKTLPAAMAIVRSMSTCQNFSTVVATASAVDQWEREFTKYFEKGTTKVFVLRDQTITYSQLLKYNVVITSYDFVVSQFQKLDEYETRIKAWTDSPKSERYQEKRPITPNLSLFSNLDTLQSPYLVLDDAQTVRKSDSAKFRAVTRLRESSHACIMLTGSPLENDWKDMYALSTFLRAHPFETFETFKVAFSAENLERPGKRLQPRGRYMERLQYWMQCFILQREQETIDLPGLTEEEVPFEVPIDELNASNTASTASQALREQPGMKERSREEMVRSMQIVNHPMMPEVMHFVSTRAMLHPEDSDENMRDNFTDQQREMYDKWHRKLSEGKNWRSARIFAVIDLTVYSSFKFAPGKVVVMDSLVYFLDIVEIALRKTAAPVQVLRLDGRTPPEQRQGVIDRFSKAPSPAVLLASSAAAGSGLNLQAASVLILCNVFIHESQEKQAIGQLWRRGQSRPVHVFSLRAHGPIKVEMFTI